MFPSPELGRKSKKQVLKTLRIAFAQVASLRSITELETCPKRRQQQNPISEHFLVYQVLQQQQSQQHYESVY